MSCAIGVTLDPAVRAVMRLTSNCKSTPVTAVICQLKSQMRRITTLRVADVLKSVATYLFWAGTTRS